MAEPTNRRPHSDLLSANLVLLATLFLFLLMLIKVTRVANLNLPTAYAILSTTGPVNVALGALTLTLPIILIGILSFSASATDSSSSRVRRATGHLIASLTVATSAYLTHVYITLLLAVLYLAHYVIRKLVVSVVGPRLHERRARQSGSAEHRLREFIAEQSELTAFIKQRPALPEAKAKSEATTKESRAIAEDNLAIAEERLAIFDRQTKEIDERLEKHKARRAEMEQLLESERTKYREFDQLALLVLTAGTLIPLLFTPLLSSSLWLPAEQFEMTDGSTLVGYTLASDGEWHSILLEDTRTVQHLKPATIASRNICSIDEDRTVRPIADRLSRKSPAPRYPSCSPQE